MRQVLRVLLAVMFVIVLVVSTSKLSVAEGPFPVPLCDPNATCCPAIGIPCW